MKTIKTIIGAIGVVFAINPFVSWAIENSNNSSAQNENSTSEQGDQNITVENVKAEDLEIRTELDGRLTVIVHKNNKVEARVGTPTCLSCAN